MAHPYAKYPPGNNISTATQIPTFTSGLYVRFWDNSSSGGYPSTTPGGSGWTTPIGTSAGYTQISFADNYGGGTYRLPQDDYCSVYAKGYYYTPTSGTLQVQTVSDDGVQVVLGGTTIINNWTLHGGTTNTSSAVSVSAGYTPFYLIYFEWGGGAIITMQWKTGSSSYTSDLSGSFFYETLNP
jgi:hypothetical protein